MPPSSKKPETEASQTTLSESDQAIFSELFGDDEGETGKTDAAKAELEAKIQEERDARSEERFAWIVICVILVDVLWFRNAPNPAIPIVVLILEILIFFVLAKRMGIEKLELLFEGLIHSFGRKGSGG
jgi:hypothetical protein